MTQKFGRIGKIASQNDVQNIKLFLTQLSQKIIHVHFRYWEKLKVDYAKLDCIFMLFQNDKKYISNTLTER